MNQRLDKLMNMEKQQPADAFLKFAIALEYINLGSDAEAKEYFNWLLINEPAYVATYYQLGQLLERMNERSHAMQIYRDGIEKAKAANDPKTAGELQEALTLLEDE